MIHQSIDPAQTKGWFVGPWNTAVSIPVGYANQGINEPHYHEQMFEIYLIAQGWSMISVENQLIKLKSGDILVVEPGERHTFTQSSEDYLHFVIHTPFIFGDKVLIKSDSYPLDDQFPTWQVGQK